MTDSNVHLSRWPFRRLPGDEPADLVARLRRRGVTEAWAGSFDALLHEDIAAVNARLAADCGRFGANFLVPFGTVNVRLPDWQEDLRRCVEDHRMPGIRLYPGYQGYSTDNPLFADLLQRAASLGLIVQVVVTMEDERTQHPLMRVPDLDLNRLTNVIAKAGSLRLQILNARRLAPELIAKLKTAGNVYFDFSCLEGVSGLSRLIEQAPDRAIFGSHFPYYYFESSILKIREAGLDEVSRRAVLVENAARLRSGGKSK